MKVSQFKMLLAAFLLTLLAIVVVALYCAYSDAQHHLLQSIELRASGRPYEAIDACKMALQLDPALAAAHYQMALTYLGIGRYIECLTACYDALALDPVLFDRRHLDPLAKAAGEDREFLERYLQLGREYLSLEKTGRSHEDAPLRAYAMAFDLDARISYRKFSADAPAVGARILAVISDKKASSLSADVQAGRFDEALQFVRAYKPAAAGVDERVEELYLQLRKLHDSHTRCMASAALAERFEPHLAATSLYIAGKISRAASPEAIRRLNDIISGFSPGISAEDPATRAAALRNVAAARQSLAQLYIERAKFDSASLELEKLIEISNREELRFRLFDVRSMLGYVYFKQGRYDDALATVEPQDAGGDSRAGFVRAVVALRRSGGDPDAARNAARELTRSVGGSSDWFEGQYALALAQFASARHREALRSFDRAASLKPHSMPAQLGAVAVAFLLRSDRDAAERADILLNMLPADESGHAGPLLIAGCAQLRLGNLERAEKLLDRLAEGNPENGTGQLVRIATKLAGHPGKDTYDQLIEHCRSLNERTKSTDWLLARAFVQLDAGRLADARATLELLLDDGSDQTGRTALLMLGRIDLIEGKAGDAASRFGAGLKRWPCDALIKAWADGAGALAHKKDTGKRFAGALTSAPPQDSPWTILVAAYDVARAQAPPDHATADMLRLDPFVPTAISTSTLLYDAGEEPALPINSSLMDRIRKRQPGLHGTISDRGAFYRADATKLFRQIIFKRLNLWDELIGNL